MGPSLTDETFFSIQLAQSQKLIASGNLAITTLIWKRLFICCSRSLFPFRFFLFFLSIGSLSIYLSWFASFSSYIYMLHADLNDNDRYIAIFDRFDRVMVIRMEVTFFYGTYSLSLSHSLSLSLSHSLSLSLYVHLLCVLMCVNRHKRNLMTIIQMDFGEKLGLYLMILYLCT